MIDIAIITGSVRMGRQSQKVAYYLEQKLNEREISVDLIDLGEYTLPLLRERVGRHPEPPEDAVEISDRLDKSDALILVSPEYHGSVSGVLKNALDYFRKEFQGKPIGVATASAGGFGGINASNQLQHIILSMGGYPMPQKLLVPKVQDAFDADLEPRQDRLEQTTGKFLDDLLWQTEAFDLKKEQDQSLKQEVA